MNAEPDRPRHHAFGSWGRPSRRGRAVEAPAPAASAGTIRARHLNTLALTVETLWGAVGIVLKHFPVSRRDVQ
jgi:hypothetical protein